MATIFGYWIRYLDLVDKLFTVLEEEEGLNGGRLQRSYKRITAKRHREAIADPLTASTGLRFAELRLRLRA